MFRRLDQTTGPSSEGAVFKSTLATRCWTFPVGRWSFIVGRSRCVAGRRAPVYTARLTEPDTGVAGDFLLLAVEGGGHAATRRAGCGPVRCCGSLVVHSVPPANPQPVAGEPIEGRRQLFLCKARSGYTRSTRCFCFLLYTMVFIPATLHYIIYP